MESRLKMFIRLIGGRLLETDWRRCACAAGAACVGWKFKTYLSIWNRSKKDDRPFFWVCPGKADLFSCLTLPLPAFPSLYVCWTFDAELDDELFSAVGISTGSLILNEESSASSFTLDVGWWLLVCWAPSDEELDGPFSVVWTSFEWLSSSRESSTAPFIFDVDCWVFVNEAVGKGAVESRRDCCEMCACCTCNVDSLRWIMTYRYNDSKAAASNRRLCLMTTEHWFSCRMPACCNARETERVTKRIENKIIKNISVKWNISGF